MSFLNTARESETSLRKPELNIYSQTHSKWGKAYNMTDKISQLNFHDSHFKLYQGEHAPELPLIMKSFIHICF